MSLSFDHDEFLLMNYHRLSMSFGNRWEFSLSLVQKKCPHVSLENQIGVDDDSWDHIFCLMLSN